MLQKQSLSYKQVKEVKETTSYGVMKDRLPENVKQGLRTSVQGRLKKALEKSVELAPADINSKEPDAKIKKVEDLDAKHKVNLLEKSQLNEGSEKLDVKNDWLEKLKLLAQNEQDEEQRKLWERVLEDREKELASYDDYMRKTKSASKSK
jgi:hypothetical protein